MLTSRILSLMFAAVPAVIPPAAWTQSSDRVPLQNWQAPLSWQATTPQELTAAKQAGGRAPKPEISAPGSPASLGVLVSITPCRLVDTRSNMPQPYGAGSSTPLTWPASSFHTIPAAALTAGAYPAVANPCAGLPQAQAYSANITVWPQPQATILKWLSVCPTGTLAATCSGTATLTGYEGGTSSSTSAIVSNAAVIPANASGSFDVFVTDPAWVIIDINGYYVSPNALALGAGTASSPSLTFSNDTNSGLYSPSAGTVKMAASGMDRLTVNAAGVAVAGNLDVGGMLTQNGNPLLQAGTPNVALGFGAAVGGSYSTAIGYHTLQNNISSDNTAVGFAALQSNMTGISNTAVGSTALMNNTTGYGNSANGFSALGSNTTGAWNTVIGSWGLTANTTGSFNTAVGAAALGRSTTAQSNTAVGANALFNNTTGQSNTATGNGALQSSTTACCNVANGVSALASNTIGSGNTAVGNASLMANTTGAINTAFGASALQNNTSGNTNIAIGSQAALNVSGVNSNNIHIGSSGVASDNGAIRIGTPGTQTTFFAAGIRGASTANSDAVPIFVDSAGQLGTVNSSRRFKEDIRDMDESSRGLMRLRPVTFRYRQPFADGSKPVQYGLIAEEVAEVYPDLVAHSAGGQTETVKYQVLDSMLLNEFQRQERKIAAQQDEIRDLQRQVSELLKRSCDMPPLH